MAVRISETVCPAEIREVAGVVKEKAPGVIADVKEKAPGVIADVKEKAETIAGMMLEIKRDFPRRGDKITLHGVRFTVLAISGHHAEEIRVEMEKNNK